ncbi:MAG: TRAP transporter small permease [Caldimonas sp.]|uniref:TRAP transporter small permease n=1 Tax=Caldimonas sp. TaxID=2838790 RepID=UPI00391ACDAB
MYHLLRWTAMVFALIGGLAAALVGCMTVASIVSRTLWSTPIQGDVELTQFGIALAISLCLPWCQLHGGNIIVDFFTLKASERSRQVLDGIGAVLLAAMVILLAWRTGEGAISVKDAGETSMIMGLPMWIVYVVLAPGFALTALIALYQALMHFLGRESEATA